MDGNIENVNQFSGEDMLMAIKTEPEMVYETEDNANSTSDVLYTIKRVRTPDNFEPPTTNSHKKFKNCCQNCIDFKSYIDDLFKKQSEKMQEHNTQVMHTLQMQSHLIEILVRQERTAGDLRLSFPIKSEDALVEFNNNINDDNKHLYVTAMKDIIRNNLCKNMDLIITEELIYNYNVDGTHGKKGLKDLVNFYSAFKKLLDNCVSSDGDQFVKKISKIDAKKEDAQKLRELLKEFALEDALPFLRSSHVTYRSLQYLRKDDLKEAIPPMGLRVEFREKLFAWRKRKFGINEDLKPTKVEEWLSEMPSFSSMQNQEQEQPSNSHQANNTQSVLKKNLKSILMETTKGKKILKMYNEFQILNDVNRNDLLNIIIEEIIFSKIILQQRDFSCLVDEICTLFPTEKDGREYYYVPRHGKKNPSGRLYSKYTNCRSKTRKLESSSLMIESPASTPAHTDNIDNMDELSEIKMDLNSDILNWSKIQDLWKTTFSLRQMDLKTMSSEEFLKAWPKYTYFKAPELIKIDFSLMHPGKGNLLFTHWDSFKEKIKQYYEISIHNENCMQLFLIGKSATNKDSQDYIYTTLLNAILPSTVRFKNSSGKCTKKITIAEAQESFALRLDSINDYEINIEQLINKYYSTELTIQPFLIVEGPTIEKLKGFYVYFDKNLYKFETFYESLDLCFKIFNVFSLPYPKACEPLWAFIQQYFFDIYQELDCKSANLISLLKFMKKSPTTSNTGQNFMKPYQYYSITLKNDPDDNSDDYLSENAYEPEKKRKKGTMNMLQNLEKNLLFTKYFTIKETVKNGVIAECRTCNTTIKASVNVTSNFIRHLKSRHSKEFEEYIKLKIGRKETAKMKIDHALIDFLIDQMISFSLVEKATFKTFVNLLQPNYSLPPTQIIMQMFNERYNNMINSIKFKLKSANIFCTTADVWCTKQKLFFAYSCHWIDPNTFKRISTTLALKRFKRSHNYEEFKDIIHEVHHKFGLTPDNVIVTVTDNGINFTQLFKEIGIDKFCEEDETYTEGGDIDCIDIGEYLPHSYIKCAGHALNLYASADFKDALVECQLYEKNVVILQKCKHLWLKSQNDIIKTLLGNTLKYPVVTKWNSLYYSIQEIVKYKNNINDVCNALHLPPFSDDDFLYLKEYLEVNKPIAEAIKFLQCDNNMLYGYLLPTLATIRMKLKILLKNSSKNKYFNAMFTKKLEEKLLQRFPNYFELNDKAESAIIASVLCPDVKLDWVMALNPDVSSGLKEELARKVQNVMEVESEDSLQVKEVEEELPNSSKYFQFTTQENSNPSPTKTSNEFLTYMVDTSKNIEMLNKYPNIKKAFIKYNTPLPSSSASSVRLFEYSGLESTPHGGQFTSDDYIEKLVLLKINLTKVK